MAWFKPKGWEELSKEDRDWLKEAKGLSVPEQLKLCARFNKPDLVGFLLKAYRKKKMNWEDVYQAALTAVEKESVEALKIILSYNSNFAWVSGSDSDQAATIKLFQAVLPDSISIWKILYTANTSAHWGKLGELDIIKTIKPEMSHDIFRFHLDRAHKSENVIFQAFIKVGLQSTEKLKFILGWTEKFSAAIALDSALVSVIEAEDMEKTKLLLEKNADPNYSGALALRTAIEKDNQEIIALLRPRMNHENYGESLIAELKKKITDASKLEWLEKDVKESVARKFVKKNQENYILVDADTLSETKQLPSGMTLTTLFNFKSSQQIFIVEKTGEKQSLAVTEKDFSEIGNQDYLEAMRLKFVELGGKSETITRLPKKGLSRD
jgi:hypothetical protein